MVPIYLYKHQDCTLQISLFFVGAPEGTKKTDYIAFLSSRALQYSLAWEPAANFMDKKENKRTETNVFVR
jgi:hypothetical protein